MADPTLHNEAVPGRLAAAVAGALAAATALAAGHLAGALTVDTRSPVVVVGEAVIERVPVPVERFAIETFGSNDKPVLVAGIVVVCILLGAVLAVVGRRRPLRIAAGFAAFGVVGVLAAVDRGAGPVAAVVPSTVAAVTGWAAAIGLLRLAPASHPSGPGIETPIERPKDGLRSRRAFLLGSGAVLAGIALLRTAGSAAAGRFSAAASRAGITLPRAARPLPSATSTVDAGVAGVTPFFTPNADFYRVDTALVVPQVPAESWQLRIHGMVDRPMTIGFEELVDRGLVEADITLTCVSNPVGGNLAGNARWLGVPLRQLLDEVGVAAAADQIVGRSVDGWTCGFPVSAAYDRNAIVAVGMNGEPLPIEHGFPARLVTPGLYGYVSAAKWLTEIELTTFDAFDPYWVRRGWAAEAPIKTMTRIDTPRALAPVSAGPVTIGGVAWAQTRGIEQVEVSIDDGPWETARLADALGPDTWRQWTLPWDAAPGRHTITARATDGTGELQTDTRAEPFPDGASGWQSLLVTVEQPAT